MIGILVGGSAATAALWLRSRRSLSWRRHDVDKLSQLPDESIADQFVCVLDGLSRPYRRDAIEVATCFGITDVWVRISDTMWQPHKRDEWCPCTQSAFL